MLREITHGITKETVKSKSGKGSMCTFAIPAFKRWRQEDHKFKVVLGVILSVFEF